MTGKSTKTAGNNHHRPESGGTALQWADVALMSGGGLAVSTVTAFFIPDMPYHLALGSTATIASVVLFSIAWVSYLRRDGVRFFNPRKGLGKSHSGSWQERVPDLGAPPPPAAPVPDEKGPESSDYRRLEKAEADLRRRITGTGEDGETGTGAPAKGSAHGNLLLGSGISAALLLLIALFLQYIFPALAGK